MALQFHQPTDNRRIETLAALWENAKAAVTHPAGCACVGGVALALDPRVIEDDVLDYLHAKYGSGQTHRLLAVIRTTSTTICPAGTRSFAQWLACAVHLPKDERERLFDDLCRAC